MNALSPRGTGQVGVIVLSWNALRYTRRCLDSLRRLTAHPDFELDVVVVDNGSTDGTVEWLRGLDGITVVANGRNLGFTAGVNIGLGRIAPGADAVLLNNDLLIGQRDWLERLRECAYATTSTGIVGCRQVDGNGWLLHAGSYVCPIGMQGEQIGGGEVDIGQYVRRREVEAVVGSVMYLRRDMLEAVGGGLHGEYFSYFEDTDLCYAARAHGFDTVYCGDVTLTHYQNVSTRENRADLWEMFEQSRTIFRRRWGATIASRFDAHVELRARWDAGGPGESLAIALHESGVAVAARTHAGERATSKHPLVRDMGSGDPPPGTDVVVLGTCPSTAPTVGARRFRYLLEAPGGAIADCDEIWVATPEAAALAGTAVKAGTPVRVVPIGVDPDRFHPGIRRLRREDGMFRFVLLRPWDQVTEELAATFAAAFGPDDPVLLHVHTGPGPPPAAGIDGAGRIVVTSGAHLDASGRPALYRSADAVLVVPDPFDPRPEMECRALGVPVVAATGDHLPTRLHDAVTSGPLDTDPPGPPDTWMQTAATVRGHLAR